jgi:hypothetical protein
MTDQTGAPFETRLTAALQEWVAQAHDPRPAAEIANVAMRPRGLRSRLGGTRRSRRMLYFAVAAVLLVSTSYIGARLLNVPMPNLIDQVPQPTATVAPTTAPPPDPTAAQVAAWAADICGINAAFLVDLRHIIWEDFREPREPSVEELRQVELDRRPSIEAAYQSAKQALANLTPYPGGEPFRQALLAEFQSELDDLPGVYEAIAAATTTDEIYAANRINYQSAGFSNVDTSRSVLKMDVAFSDAVAAIPRTTFCRWYEFDARARVHGIETPDFSQVIFQDDFDDDSNFKNTGFDSGRKTITDGTLKLLFSSSYKVFLAAPGQYRDARIETHLRFDKGSYFAGLACRGDDATGYQVLLGRDGQVLINASDADYHVMGRVPPPETFDVSNGVDLAVECFGGDTDPFTIVVYVNGERVAEVQAEHATVSAGPWGIFANSYSGGDELTFDSLRILVEP